MIRDCMIHKFIRERGGKATEEEIFEALWNDEESRRMIEEKLTAMERFGIFAIDGDEVTLGENP